MGLVELINLQAGEMGQLVLHKLFGWVSPVEEVTNLYAINSLRPPDSSF